MSNIVKVVKWQELYDDGKIWIDGQIGIVPETYKHLYNHRLEFKGYEGIPVCRVGIWSKYYDNGQLAWKVDYGDGTHIYKSKEKFNSYRKDGSIITQ